MSIIVEDGTVVAGAESYATVSYFKAYFRVRGNEVATDIDVPDIEAALRKATDYLDSVYSAAWQGCRRSINQNLDWPREGVVLNGFSFSATAIPDQLKKACCELALRSRSADLLADQSRAKLSVKVGPLETTYDPYSPQAKRYPAVAALLAALTVSRGGVNVRLERA